MTEESRLRELASRALKAWQSSSEPGLSAEVELERLQARNAALMKLEIEATPQAILSLLDTIDELRARVAALRHRLEVDRVWREKDGQLVEEPADLSESLDGISCRDETIKLQDEKLAAKDARIALLEKALAPFAQSFSAKLNRYSEQRQKWAEEMPGEWPIEIIVTMAECREARALVKHGQTKG